MDDLRFLERMRDWVRQWGEREYYYIRQEDLEYAIANSLCTVLLLNKHVYIRLEKQYLFYRNVIVLEGKYFINTDLRSVGN